MTKAYQNLQTLMQTVAIKRLYHQSEYETNEVQKIKLTCQKLSRNQQYTYIQLGSPQNFILMALIVPTYLPSMQNELYVYQNSFKTSISMATISIKDLLCQSSTYSTILKSWQDSNVYKIVMIHIRCVLSAWTKMAKQSKT